MTMSIYRKAGTVGTLAVVALAIGTGCGADGTGGTDTQGTDGGHDLKIVDVNFDMSPPMDLIQDVSQDLSKDVFQDPGTEKPLTAPAPDTPGQVIVTEFLAKSQGGSDQGEWVELFNFTAGPLDLGGCEFGDDGSDGHLISAHLIVESGGFVVLAKTDDPELNHGLVPDYLYNDFTLSNTEDEIVLSCGGTEIDRVAFTGDWVEEGVAIQLGSTAFDATLNDAFESWCPANLGYGTAGMLGTPGESNEECIPPDPCDPNPCNDPSPRECDPDGVTLITYQSPAACTDEAGLPVCGSYPFTTLDCSLEEEVCVDGYCVPPPPPQPDIEGEILVTEFMAKSQGGSDPGEWVELFNAGAEVLDLGGCILGDDNNDGHVLAGPLLVDSGQYLLLAKSDDGFMADYLYTGFNLVNDGDEIVLTCDAGEIDRVVYTGDWVVEGAAAQLSQSAMDAQSNDDPAYWCAADTGYGDNGKLGTPGLVNGECPDVCDPNPCIEYPAPQCDPDDVTLFTWSTPAPCTGTFGAFSCGEYPMDSLDCSLDDKICLDGACIDPCDPNPCTDYPASVCGADGITLSTWETAAPCSSGAGQVSCGEYPETTFDCSTEGKVCVGGACVPDPCDPNPCTTPPGPTCDPDGVTRVVYTSPASCTNDGANPVCGEYPFLSLDCSLSQEVCVAGECVEAPDPCDPNPCITPPGPTCDPDGVTRITYETPAPCTVEYENPVCGEYSPTTFDCSTEGKTCQDGSCVTPASQPDAAGQVLINEFMVRSQAGADPGEWVELINKTDQALDLDGCVLLDDDVNSHTVVGSLVIQPAGLVLLAKGDDGYTADYLYTNFFLGNEPDEIVLKCGEVEIDRVNYTDAWYHLGRSTRLDPGAQDVTANDDAANWCAGITLYGEAGKLGTPGFANPDCPDDTVEWCRLQWPLDPPDASVVAGEELTVYGHVNLAGITNLTPNTDEYPELIGQVGYGPDGSDPDGNGGWIWNAAGPNLLWVDTLEPGNDEYMGTLNVAADGTYDHAYRFSADGGSTWTYCDRRIDDNSDGSNDGYQTANAGNLEVTVPQ